MSSLLEACQHGETNSRKINIPDQIKKYVVCVQKNQIRVTRLFSFTGKSRRICENIKIVTDIEILEADERSDVICQKCDRKKKLCSHSVKRVILPPKRHEQENVPTANFDLNSKSRRKQLFSRLVVLRPKILSDISPVNLNDPIVLNTRFVSVLHHVQSFELSPAESVYSSNKDIFLCQPFLTLRNIKSKMYKEV